MTLVYVLTGVYTYFVTLHLISHVKLPVWMTGGMGEPFPTPKETKKTHNVQLGKYAKGIVYHNFKKFPHMIVAGGTGYGKTTLLKGIVSQLKGEIVLLDLKNDGDYGVPVTATNIEGASRVLKDVSDFIKSGRSVKGQIYVVVDEAAELLAPEFLSKKESRDYLECQAYVSDICRLGRSRGVHLIYATQYPTADVIPRQVKQNCETRIVFRLPTVRGSMVALDEPGAEELPSGVPGRFIYKRDYMFEGQAYEFYGGVEDYHVKIRGSKVEGTRDIEGIPAVWDIEGD